MQFYVGCDLDLGHMDLDLVWTCVLSDLVNG